MYIHIYTYTDTDTDTYTMLTQLTAAAKHANKRLNTFYKQKIQIQKGLCEANMFTSVVLDRKLIEIEKLIRAEKMRIVGYNESIYWMSRR